MPSSNASRRRRRQLCKELGLCTDCSIRPVSMGVSSLTGKPYLTCENCREYRKRDAQNRRDHRNYQGLCIVCGDEPVQDISPNTGAKYKKCNDCLDKSLEATHKYNKKKRAAQLELRSNLKAQGYCTRCAEGRIINHEQGLCFECQSIPYVAKNWSLHAKNGKVI